MQGVGQDVQQVKQPRIEVANVPGAGIAQKMVQPVEGGRQIRIALAIDNFQPLVGVGVIKTELVFAGRREGGVTKRRRVVSLKRSLARKTTAGCW